LTVIITIIVVVVIIIIIRGRVLSPVGRAERGGPRPRGVVVVSYTTAVALLGVVEALV
jgi:hypothetical protein